MTLSDAVDTVIVTPTLGDRDTLQRTIDSVRDVGGTRVKHVLVCPAARVTNLQRRFAECEVIAEPERAGVFAAVNLGLARATGNSNYVGYINDDDYWLPAFRSLFAALDADTGAAGAYGRVWFVDESNHMLFESTSWQEYRAFKSLFARGIVMFTQQATLLRRTVYEQLRGFDPRYKLASDSEFWVRIVDAGHRLVYVNEPCAAYTISGNQLSSDRDGVAEEDRRICREHGAKRGLRSLADALRYRIANAPRYAWRVVQGRGVRVATLFDRESRVGRHHERKRDG